MEILEPIREKITKPEIKLDELREELKEQKEKCADSHFVKINPNELTCEDLIIYDKFKKNDLSDLEFKTYRECLQEYFDEQKKQKNEKKKEFNIFKDSRSNFSAMILNKIIDKNYKEKYFN